MSKNRTAAFLLISLPFIACQDRSAERSAAGRPPLAPPVSGVGVVAEVNGAPIMASELDERAAPRLARLRQEEFSIRSAALDELVAERLLDAEAARQGVSRDKLLQQEVDAKARRTSLETVQSVYRENESRFAGQTKEQAFAKIRQVFDERARAERRARYVADLRARARVAVRLEPPRIKLEVPTEAPARGPVAATVTIVEFTDYQCPFCHRAQAVMDQVLERYRDKLRLVHFDFPIDGHPGAMPAARAARCAGDQGRFWEYHHGLMTEPGALDEADLKARAARLGLPAGAFAACLSSGRHDAAILASARQGESVGVNGTPAYFVNGRMLSGAQPLEEFTAVIDGELATTSR